MCENKVLPDFFFSKEPLKEKINLIRFGGGKHKELYWMLEVVNHKEQSNNSSNYNNYSQLAPYNDNDSEMIDCFDLEDNYEINPTKSGKFITSFYLPPALHSAIIGPRGSKLRELQEKTQTLIKVPKPGEIGEKIKITGHNERSVASARTQISLITLTKRENMAITHFISVPVTSKDIKTNFNTFKNKIFNGPAARGVDESIFQKPEKFHLTIVTLTLLDEREIEEVKGFLKTLIPNIVEKFFNGVNRIITLQGVEIMNDDPSDVNVLYGKINLKSSEDNEKFQILADEIMNCFSRNSLIRKQYDNVKFHVTLMNSLFRRKIEDDYEKVEARNRQKRESFDASYILDKFKDYYFGQSFLNDIHLSIRFTTNSNSGYYDSEITLPIVL